MKLNLNKLSVKNQIYKITLKFEKNGLLISRLSKVKSFADTLLNGQIVFNLNEIK